MLCSVLIPTRGRVGRLKSSINSIYEHVSNQSSVEILIRKDDDDKDDYSGIESIPNVKVFSGDRKNGWNSVSDFYTELAGHSKSKWLWLYNDDALLEGSDWDVELSKLPTNGFIAHPQIYKLNNSVYPNWENGNFPIVPNGFWSKLGLSGIPDPPDTATFDAVKKHGWEAKFLRGVNLFHDRIVDATLPKWRF